MSNRRKPTLFMTLEDTLVRACETRLLSRKEEFNSLTNTSVFLSGKRTTTHIFLRPEARAFISEMQEYVNFNIVSYHSKKDMEIICINTGLPYEGDTLISLHPQENPNLLLEKVSNDNAHRSWILFDNGICPQRKIRYLTTTTNEKFLKKREYNSSFYLKNFSKWELMPHVLPILDHMDYFKRNKKLGGDL